MVQVPRRTAFADSALVRLLARWNEAEVREPAASTAERLSQWLAWTDAIALSTVLNAPATRAKAIAGPPDDECARVRDGLARTIRDDSLYADVDEAAVGTIDFAPYRLRYLARQQAMEAGVGPLRAKLRSALAARSAAMAKLATVDAVMEQALEARGHSLLATVPAMLEKRFKHLHQAALPAPDAPETDAAPTAWLPVFHQDIRDLLLAELDFRFQPVDGLLEALRSH
ncbi:DUF3348 domain-containing protein [Variovorax sp. LT2P21]|uniref:DUF3348 domain-containing protein n=1 Tax=Variovorax sp. LT2P21 TaxID=3443731 RepID=UPI003F4784E1